jgi:AcrR family transcriptional regulator
VVQTKKSELKQTILMVARREFIRKGYRGANLRIIAQKTPCSLSNLYNYFESKDDLFKQLLEPRLNEIRQAFEMARAILPPEGMVTYDLEDEQRYHKYVIDYIDTHRQDLKLIFLKSHGSSVEQFQEYVIDEYQEMWTRYIHYLKENFPEKAKQRISDFFIHTISSSYLNSMMECLIHDIPYEDMLRYSEQLTVYSYYGFLGLLEQ